MPSRCNPCATMFARAFELGRLYQRGAVITTERVRCLFGVSVATAKRDLRAMRRAGAQLPRKPAAIPPVAAPLVTAAEPASELIDAASA